jgi:hypothetical protein
VRASPRRSSPLTASAAETAPVAIQDFSVQPSTITIEEGDTVVWTIPEARLPVLFGVSTVLAGLGAWSLRRRQHGPRHTTSA